MLVLLVTLLIHAGGPGTWHGHVEAPCCWETLHAGTPFCDWRKPDWVEWAPYIEQETWRTGLIHILSFSVPQSLLCSLSLSYMQMFTGTFSFIVHILLIESVHVKFIVYYCLQSLYTLFALWQNSFCTSTVWQVQNQDDKHKMMGLVLRSWIIFRAGL